ncbi:hypothetical protein QPX96_07850 [Limosilactobacillus fermentum]|nr:hypothetical protein [Limosilactobacillus fermentum]
MEYEPPLALFASENGLAFYRRLFAAAGEHLTPRGSCLVKLVTDKKNEFSGY